MTRRNQPRVPFSDLLTYWGPGWVSTRRTEEGVGYYEEHDEWSRADMTILAEAIGESRRSVHRWAAEGGIPLRSAERVADHLGVTGYEIWGTAYGDAVRDEEEHHARVRRRKLDRHNERQRARRRAAAALPVRQAG